jgi:hypothetical protein
MKQPGIAAVCEIGQHAQRFGNAHLRRHIAERDAGHRQREVQRGNDACFGKKARRESLANHNIIFCGSIKMYPPGFYPAFRSFV